MDLRLQNLLRPALSVADALAIVSCLDSRRSSPRSLPDAEKAGNAAGTLTGDPRDSFAQLLRSRLKINA
jgi:hypothetical protein